MDRFKRSHLTNASLMSAYAARLSLDRNTTADLLADMAEIDLRRLYVPDGYSSMHEYCVEGCGMSDDVAYKRIHAARAARRFPAIFHAVADGRLHLSAVVMLAPHLEGRTADELLAAAAHKTKTQLELMLSKRSPKPDVPTLVRAIPAAGPAADSALGTEAPALELAPGRVVTVDQANSPGQMEPLAAPIPAPSPTRARPEPLSPGRFALQVTIDQATHDQLRHAQSLLGHALPSGDVAEVLKRALDALVRELEKKKFAKSDRPQPQRAPAKSRHVPNEVKRQVWERDGGRCAFTSEKGKRCEARSALEYDHIQPVARGGPSTAANLRLRCRAHNQYAADCTFGAGFMDARREAARATPASPTAAPGSR